MIWAMPPPAMISQNLAGTVGKSARKAPNVTTVASIANGKP